MVVESINWMAGGPQGSGVDSASTIFGRACGYGGLYVLAEENTTQTSKQCIVTSCNAYPKNHLGKYR